MVLKRNQQKARQNSWDILIISKQSLEETNISLCSKPNILDKPLA